MGVAVDRDDWAGSTPLHWAAYAGAAPVVELLLAHRAEPAVPNRIERALPIHLAARYNRSTEALELLAKAAPELVDAPSARGNTPLHETAYEGHVAAAALLLAHGADLEAVNNADERGGLTPLLAGAAYGHVALVRSKP